MNDQIRQRCITVQRVQYTFVQIGVGAKTCHGDILLEWGVQVGLLWGPRSAGGPR